MDVVGIGKIEDIFAHRGITTVDHTKNNHDGIESTLRFLKEGRGDFIFTNLVDFDMLYGHRNDVEGYAAALEYFDSRLPELLEAMKDGDFVIITADHGCDPCFREQIIPESTFRFLHSGRIFSPCPSEQETVLRI